LVEHQIATANCIAYGVLVGDRTDDQPRPGVDVLPKSRLEVVERDDLVTALEQCVDDMRADESCSAGDQRLHRVEATRRPIREFSDGLPAGAARPVGNALNLASVARVGSWKAVSNRELRVPAFLLAALVVGVACSSGSASSGGSSTTTSTTVGGPTSSLSSTTTIPEGYATLAALLLTNVPRGLTLQPDKIGDTGATNLDKAIQHAVAPNEAQVLKV